MKRFFIATLLTICFGSGFSQVKAPVKLTLSEEMKEPAQSTVSDFIGEDESNYYLLRSKSGYSNSVFILESYDKNLHFKLRQELNPEASGKDATVDKVIFIGNQLYVFFSDADKKTGVEKLFYQTVNKNTLVSTGAPKLLLSIPYESKRKEGSFHYDISRDKKMLAIVGSTGDEKNIRQKFEVIVLNDQMEKQWGKEITLPYESKLFGEDRVTVDSRGNLYILGRLYTDKVTEKRNGEPNYAYKILSYRDGGASTKEYSVTLQDNFITDLGFSITDDDHIICGGFYSEKGTFSIKGTYFMMIDAASGQVIRQGTKAFDPNFLELFMSEGKAEKGKELYEYDLR